MLLLRIPGKTEIQSWRQIELLFDQLKTAYPKSKSLTPGNGIFKF